MEKNYESRKGNWHTTRWYRDNWKVDPEKSNISPKEVRNPYYRKAAPMKLYLEEDVAQIKGTEKQIIFAKRHDAGKKASETRKNNLIKLFSDIKSTNPEISKITERLWQIGEEIAELHTEKEDCRNADDDFCSDYFEYGTDHCIDCAAITKTQDKLRRERELCFKEIGRGGGHAKGEDTTRKKISQRAERGWGGMKNGNRTF